MRASDAQHQNWQGNIRTGTLPYELQLDLRTLISKIFAGGVLLDLQRYCMGLIPEREVSVAQAGRDSVTLLFTFWAFIIFEQVNEGDRYGGKSGFREWWILDRHLYVRPH